jgi:hypothetical protein
MRRKAKARRDAIKTTEGSTISRFMVYGICASSDSPLLELASIRILLGMDQDLP